MSTSPLRCGMLGTGVFAHTHAEAIAHTKGCTLSSVVDVNANRAKEFAAKWKCAAHTDLSSLLVDGLDIVAIVTPNTTHAELIQKLLTHEHAPRLVITEKPLCTSAKELAMLETLLKGKEDRLVVDHSRRFNAGFVGLRQLIDSGELGSLLSAQWKYYAGWMHIGGHVVDTLAMLLGDLQCVSATKGPVDRFPEDPLLDVELTSEKFPNAPITLKGIPEHPYGFFESELYFERGRIRTQWDDIFIDRLRDHGQRSPLLWLEKHLHAEPVEHALQHMYEKSADLLLGKPSDILDIAGFASAKSTTQLLFEAQSKAQ